MVRRIWIEGGESLPVLAQISRCGKTPSSISYLAAYKLLGGRETFLERTSPFSCILILSW